MSQYLCSKIQNAESFGTKYDKKNMSCNSRKYTFWHVHPIKMQILISLQDLVKFFVASMKKLCIHAYSKSPREDSDQTAKVQYKLTPHWMHMSKGMLSSIRAQYVRFMTMVLHIFIKSTLTTE